MLTTYIWAKRCLYLVTIVRCREQSLDHLLGHAVATLLNDDARPRPCQLHAIEVIVLDRLVVDMDVVDCCNGMLIVGELQNQVERILLVCIIDGVDNLDCTIVGAGTVTFG